MFDDEPTLIYTSCEIVGRLCFDSCRDNPAEIFVTAADGQGTFDLEAENPLSAKLIELYDKVVHRVAVALLLHGNAGDDTRLAGCARRPKSPAR